MMGDTFQISSKIRSARIDDLITLAEIERAAAMLFRDMPYAFLVDAKSLPLDFVIQQFRAERVLT
jgi:hypothetical protein